MAYFDLVDSVISVQVLFLQLVRYVRVSLVFEWLTCVRKCVNTTDHVNTAVTALRIADGDDAVSRESPESTIVKDLTSLAPIFPMYFYAIQYVYYISNGFICALIYMAN